MKVIKNHPLAEFTWYKIGGPADIFYQPTTRDELQAALFDIQKQNLPATILGSGTNVLIADQGIRGAVVHTAGLKAVHCEEKADHLTICAEAGVMKATLVKEYLKRKLAPALFLSGIPGDVGGGVFMNAGVSEHISPREFCDIVDAIEVVPFSDPSTVVRLASSELTWSYRHLSGYPPGVIYKVHLKSPLQPDPEIPKKVRAATKNRLQRQPLEYPSCGSVFVNPVGHKSGALIEQAGLKGYCIGGAQVSEKHANFIINKGEATAEDVYNLIHHIKTTVHSQTGILLRTEVRFLGFTTKQDG